MIEYEEEDLFPFPRDRVWTLLTAHLDDSMITKIHPLVRSQKTLSRSGEDTVVQRSIDVRGKLMNSQWKVTLRPPEYARYEILSSEGPWSEGSTVESQYSDGAGGTLIRSRVRAHIKVLPFFLPQKMMTKSVLKGIDQQDRAFLQR
ncbi:MAG: SRPBCC family protein [Thermoplasmata archaeon]|nr:SRPBCC family protein [Thermoplasmata archaeon]